MAQASGDLINAFRLYHNQFQQTVINVLTAPTDPTVLARLGDDLDEFAQLVLRVCSLIYIDLYYMLEADETILTQNADSFEADELSILRTSLISMQTDLREEYRQALDDSHHGYPTIIERVHTGSRGRPRIQIDPVFLRWAYANRSVSGISRFLHVGRSTVRNALMEYGIAEPQQNPFPDVERTDSASVNDPLNENTTSPLNQTSIDGTGDTIADIHAPPLVSFTGPQSTITDDELDSLIRVIRSHFHRAGVSMLDGMLRHVGHRVPRIRISESLMRVDPLERVFQRTQISRRVYSVPGPNALWHHDGQHGPCNFWGD
jgi:hypothetical protein